MGAPGGSMLRRGRPALLALLALSAGCMDGSIARVMDAGEEEPWRPIQPEPSVREELPLVRLVNGLGSVVAVRTDKVSVFPSVPAHAVTPYRGVGPELSPFALFRRSDAGNTPPLAVNRRILRRGHRYTVVAIPEANGVGAHLRVLQDDANPDPTRAQVRLIHAAAGIGAVDVGEADPAVPLFDRVGYASSTPVQSVEPGTRTIAVMRARGHARLLTIAHLRLEAGKSYTIVLIGGTGRLESLTFRDGVELGPTDLAISR